MTITSTTADTRFAAARAGGMPPPATAADGLPSVTGSTGPGAGLSPDAGPGPGAAARRYRLIGAPGCGSAVVEAALAMAGIDAERVDLGFDEDGRVTGEAIGRLNPLREVPVLVLPDGSAMTESGAMVLHLADVAPAAGLAPPPDAPDRPLFLHRLMLICSSIYPTHVGGGLGRACAEPLMRRRKQAWSGFEALLGDDPLKGPREGAGGAAMEAAGEGPWVLGERFSALDLYLAVMTRWTPGFDWFRAECPTVAAIAWRAAGHPALAPVMARHFPAA